MATKKWLEENKDRRAKYRRTWYAKNKKKIKANVLARKVKISEWLKKLKAGLSCVKCGEGHISCIQFHHRDPKKKDIEIGRVAKNGWSFKRIQAELKKCDVLCANCHFKKHWK